MSEERDPVAAVLSQLLDQIARLVPQSQRYEFEEECARIGAAFLERLRGEPTPVPLLWQAHLIDMFDLSARWMLNLPFESAAMISAYETATVRLIGLFVEVGKSVGVDGEELWGGLHARHLHWRAEGLKKHRLWVQQQNTIPLTPRMTPGEVIAAFLARNKMNEKELIGRVAGRFSKNTLAKIKRGEPSVRSDRYTALAEAMEDVEPNFRRDYLLPI
jgi:hypothetical protein